MMFCCLCSDVPMKYLVGIGLFVESTFIGASAPAMACRVPLLVRFLVIYRLHKLFDREEERRPSDEQCSLLLLVNHRIRTRIAPRFGDVLNAQLDVGHIIFSSDILAKNNHISLPLSLLLVPNPFL